MKNINNDRSIASDFQKKSQKIDGSSFLELKLKINELERRIENYQLKLNTDQYTESELKEELNAKDDELNRLNDLTNNLKIKIDLSKDLIKDMQNRLINKDLQIKNLEKDLIANINQNYDIANKLNCFEQCLEHVDKNKEGLDKVKLIIRNKGFITEKEFEIVMGKESLQKFLIRN